MKEPKHSGLDDIQDPVARAAAQDAFSKTDPKPEKHPSVNRFLIVFAVFLAIIGTFGVIMGAINYVTLLHEKDTLKAEVTCTSQILQVLEVETNQRSAIAKQDRVVVDDLVNSIQHALATGNNDGVTQAFTNYNRERAANERRRNSLPPLPTPSACTSGPLANRIPHSSTPNVSSTPSSSPSPSASPTPSGTVNVSQPVSSRSRVVIRTSGGKTVTKTVPARPSAPRTVTKTPTATHTPTKKPSPSQSGVVLCTRLTGCITVPALPI